MTANFGGNCLLSLADATEKFKTINNCTNVHPLAICGQCGGVIANHRKKITAVTPTDDTADTDNTATAA